MLLKKLIENCPNKFANIIVKGLSSDTRKLKKGELFFALKGSQINGEKFISQAIKKGACAVISSKKNKENPKIIKVKNVRKCLGKICSKFYTNKPKNIIAVTGTNGKSSVADFFHQILSLNGLPVATIGTLGVKIKKIKQQNLTSPDIISLHKELNDLKKKKIENVLLEASSHGLKQGRLNGINLRGAIFTNFSQDHLDYHKTMKNYLNSKLILIKNLLKEKSYIITDETIPEYKIIKKIAHKKKYKKILINLFESKYNLENFKLIGDFQKKNLLMAIKACEIVGVNKKKIDKSIHKLKSVNGRLELVRVFPNQTKVFIDFAHTPDAIKVAIESLKNFYKKNITIVFGCGGERDKTKRKKIGKIVNRLCKKIFVTDDNPRREKPSKIRREIIKHIDKEKVTEIGDRTSAIHTAINQAKSNEIILIAGKGHENSQDYGKKKIKISDSKIVKDIKKNKNKSKRKINLKNNNILLKRMINTKLNRDFLGVSINSKTIKKDNLFVAIKGKNTDGHKFLKNAISKGASYCVISKNLNKIPKNKVIKVSNTYNFLKKLAILKRNYTNSNIIAVTGSSGKTSVKHLLGNLLKSYGKTYFSPRSFNNSYGVPLSLCNIEEEHKYGVSKLVKPNIAIITNIAEAHIENFKNISHIAKAKGEIIDNISTSGSLILDRDDNFFNYFKSKAEKKKIKVVSIGFNHKSDINILKVKNFLKYKLIKIKSLKREYKIKIKEQLIKNVAFAIAALEILNLDVEKIVNKIKDIKILDGRGKLYKIKYKNLNFNLIDESYNANPLSMKQSILNLSNIRNNQQKYVLLGDMLELGKKSEVLHKNLSPIINQSKINKIFIHGHHIMNTYKNVNKKKRGNILQDKSDFKEIILPILENNDYLMIKGSNATGLNKISKYLTKERVNVI